MGSVRTAVVAYPYLQFTALPSTGRIENWRLQADGVGDDLQASPCFTKYADSLNFFEAFSDIAFGRFMTQTNTSSAATLIAYLKWLIYVAAFRDRGNVAHEHYYNTEVANLNSAGAQWTRG